MRLKAGAAELLLACMSVSLHSRFVVQCHLDDRRSSATFCVFFSTASIAFSQKITGSSTVEAIQDGPAKI